MAQQEIEKKRPGKAGRILKWFGFGCLALIVITPELVFCGFKDNLV
ncbi:MAG TPA: hypothetical protein VMX13_10160 [Sedimentisphaerales bacterium]|nr:hypothetical protein [Sedimentisphaerales bacterium]